MIDFVVDDFFNASPVYAVVSEDLKHKQIVRSILGVLKIVCCCTINPDCRMPAMVSIFTASAACVLSFYAPPLYYNNNNNR